MTNAQVFRWFCKEQKIMHLIQKMYYKIQPIKIEYDIDNGGLYSKYISFDEYISNRINAFGFSYLFQRILSDYKQKLRNEMPFSQYYPFCENLDKKFEKIDKKWEYFAKNNIKVSQDSMKVGDIINFKDYGDARKMKVGCIDLYSGRIVGKLQTNGRSYGTFMAYLTDEHGEKMTLDFLIRRNKKVYHGVD